MNYPDKNRLQKLWIKTRQASRQCLNPGCEEPAIRSHMHQKAGPLANIATNGKVYVLDYFDLFGKRNYKFCEKGIDDSKNDILTFWGFCAKCDSKIFQSIEQPDVDFTLYCNQLLLAYRAVCQELYKCEYNLKFFEKVGKDDFLSPETKRYYLNRKALSSFNLNECRFLKYHLENEIRVGDTKGDFCFFTVHLPRIEVCLCDIFGVRRRLPTDDKQIDGVMLDVQESVFNTSMNFVNLIPMKDKTFFHTGYHKTAAGRNSIDIEEFNKMSMDRLLKEISDILVIRTESWCISNAFFQQIKLSGKAEELLNVKQIYLPAHMKFEKVDFNLFVN